MSKKERISTIGRDPLNKIPCNVYDTKVVIIFIILTKSGMFLNIFKNFENWS